MRPADATREAQPLWAALGPDAGRPLGVQFMQSMQSPGAFFATFTGPGGWPGPDGGGGGVGQSGNGQRAAAGGRAPYADDPSIIDAEVVEDDDEDDHGRPELHAPPG